MKGYAPPPADTNPIPQKYRNPTFVGRGCFNPSVYCWYTKAEGYFWTTELGNGFNGDMRVPILQVINAGK